MIVIAIVLALEAMGLILVTVLLIVETLASPARSAATGAALAVVTAVIAAGLVVAARGVLKAAKWTRPAAVVWQIVQLFVGLQAAQGPGARYDLAVLLALPAVAVIVLFFSPGVVAMMRRR